MKPLFPLLSPGRLVFQTWVVINLSIGRNSKLQVENNFTISAQNSHNNVMFTDKEK